MSNEELFDTFCVGKNIHPARNSLCREAFDAGIAWKEQQDLAAVKAIRGELPVWADSYICDMIAERIQEKGPLTDDDDQI